MQYRNLHFVFANLGSIILQGCYFRKGGFLKVKMVLHYSLQNFGGRAPGAPWFQRPRLHVYLLNSILINTCPLTMTVV